jgi:hypothetical protein
MPERLTFTATGTYPRTVPVDLIQALLTEIGRHMEGYGFKDIEVKSGPEET